MSESAMVDLRDISFRYPQGEFRLEIPHLSVERGEQIAVIGPSGSGKTTLLNLVAGIVTAQAGQVTTDGVDLGELPEGKRRDFRIERVGLVFQEFELLEYLNVLDNILLSYRINSTLRLDADVVQRARDLAASTGIADKLNRHPDQLSQGERQRAAVCRALLNQAPLLLADEPTGNLDPRTKGRVLDILLEHARAAGATLLLVTHDHELIDRFDRIVDFREYHAYDDQSPAAAEGGAL